jgi:NAD(P)-dependent dehydrogenase (short-subunit alcohol dehydrogenase family)
MGLLSRKRRPELIDGGVAIVTGGGSGIGRCTALALHRRGCAVAVLDLDGSTAEDTAAEITADGGRAHAWQVDVTDRARLAEIDGEVQAELGDLTILVNNAGVGVTGSLHDAALEDWDWIRSINLDGVVNGTHILGRRLLDAGAGQVVNLASGLAYIPRGKQVHYCTTKAAVLMFSQTLRGDWRKQGVGVTAVCPGIIDTPIYSRSRKFGDEESPEMQRKLQRLFSRGHPPEKVADAIVEAIDKNTAVAPVGFESKTAWFFNGRLSTGAAIRLANAPIP